MGVADNLWQHGWYLIIGIFALEVGRILKQCNDEKEYEYQFIKPFVNCILWIMICGGLILGIYGLVDGAYSMNKVVTVDYGMGDGQIPVSTITTTLFTTLMTVNLSLIALAVTAYVFLSGALNNRDSFEKNLIDKMMNERTKELIILSGYTGVGVILCLMADNAELAICKNEWIRHCIILASGLNIFFLLIFIYNIIAYEKCLLFLAEKNVRDLGKTITIDRGVNAENTEGNEDFIKRIGDLESLIDQILLNHEVEYRHPQHKQELLKRIFESKRESTQKNDELEYNKKMCDLYFDLLELRDSYLCIRKKTIKNLDAEEERKIQDSITVFFDFLKQYILREERFIDLSFSRMPFKGDKGIESELSKISFRQSAISNSSFDNAYLKEADFMGAVFHEVSMKNADCTKADFSESRFYDFIISNETKFERAVFKGTDFNGNKIGACKTENESKFDFHEICAENANLENCEIQHVNFCDSVFRHALLAHARISNCQFNYVDFVNAVMAGTVFNECSLDFANLENISGVFSSWTNCNACNARMAKSNFTESKFENSIFDKVYANDSTFNGVVLENCHFEYAMMNSSDFSYAQINNCFFNESNMTNLLFVGNHSCNHTVYSGVNFENAQIKHIIFYDCQFDDAIFCNAFLKDVVFKNCSFHNTQFESTFIMNVEWIECHNCDNLINFKDKIKFATAEDQDRFMTCCDTCLKGTNEEVMEARESIFKRRSTRNFDETYVISDTDKKLILEAGLRAPSPKNRQPWHFYVTCTPKKKASIAEIMETELGVLKKWRIDNGKEYTDLEMAYQTADIIRKASMIVLVGYEYDEANEHGEEMNWGIHARGFEAADLQAIGAAVQNMLLQATELGIASLWMCDVLYAHDALKERLRLTYPFVAAVAFGKALPEQSIRKNLDEKVECIDE